MVAVSTGLRKELIHETFWVPLSLKIGQSRRPQFCAIRRLHTSSSTNEATSAASTDDDFSSSPSERHSNLRQSLLPYADRADERHGSSEHLHGSRSTEWTRNGVMRPERFRKLSARPLSPTTTRSAGQSPFTHQKPDSIIRAQLKLWDEAYQVDQAKLRQNAKDALAVARAHGLHNLAGFELPLLKLPPTASIDERFETSPHSGERHQPRIGDLVLFRHSGVGFDFGVIVRVLSQQAVMLYDMEGLLRIKMLDTPAAYRFRHYCSSEELQGLMPHLSLSFEDENAAELDAASVPIELGREVVSKLRSLARESAAVYRDQASRIANAYDSVAYEDGLRNMTLDELAKEVFQPEDGNVSLEEKCALLCHSLLLDGPFQRIVPAEVMRAGAESHNCRWLIHSRKQKAATEQMLLWDREHRSAIASTAPGKSITADTTVARVETVIGHFAMWAREIIKRNRHRRRPIGHLLYSVDPTSTSGEATSASPAPGQDNADQDWIGDIPNEDFATIVKWFEDWHQGRFNNNSCALSIGPLILKEVGMYDNTTYDRDTAWLLLKEIGVRSPWDYFDRWKDMHVIDTTPFDDFTLTEFSHDELQGLRKDFSSIDAFAIDTRGTRLVDDAFSIESIPEEPGAHWIHVHVANPTAFLRPEHSISQRAAERVEGQFTEITSADDKNYQPMLPRELTKDLWQLAPGRQALTFSTKLDQTGRMIRSEITPSVLGSIVKMDLPTVRDILYPDVPVSEESLSHGVGPHKQQLLEMRPEAEYDPLSESQMAQLALLAQVTGQLKPYLTKRRVMDPRSIQTKLTLANVEREAPDGQLRSFSKDPSLLFWGTKLKRSLSSTELDADNALLITKAITAIVSEVAATYCSERNIPGFYNIRPRPEMDTDQPPLDATAWEEISPTRIALLTVARRVGFSPPVRLVSDPPSSGYTTMSVTSPLRRFTDLANHWQIQCALKLEASLQKKVVFEDNDPRLVFSHDRLRAHLPRIITNSAIRMDRYKRKKLHWLKQLLIRGSEFDPIPKEFSTLVLRSEQQSQTANGWLVDLDTTVRLEPNEASRAAGGYQAGDWWLTKLQPIDPREEPLQAEATAKQGYEAKDGYRAVSDPS